MFKKQWPAFVLAFVLPLVGVFWWWGGFAPVTVTEDTSLPLRYAYLDYEGPINNMRKTQRRALDEFNGAGIPAGDTLTVLLTDPRGHDGKVRAEVGYLLAEGDPVPPNLKEGRLDVRPVVRATVQAGYMLAPSKAYQAIADSGHGIVLPAVERYTPSGRVGRMGTLTVEVAR